MAKESIESRFYKVEELVLSGLKISVAIKKLGYDKDLLKSFTIQQNKELINARNIFLSK